MNEHTEKGNEPSSTAESSTSPYAIETGVVNGTQIKLWKHAATSAIDILRESRRFGSSPYIIFGQERISFEAHYAAVSRLTAFLTENCGIRKGDRIAVAMRNLPELIITYWAGMACGAIVVPLNAWWASRELEFGLQQSRCRVLISDQERLEVLSGKPALNTLEHIIVARPTRLPDSGVHVMEEIIALQDMDADHPADLPNVDIFPDDPAIILYTSGTTGAPKGAVLTHRNIVSNVVTSEFLASEISLLTAPADSKPANTQDHNETILVTTPLFHVGGIVMIIPALHRGDSLALMTKWETEPAKAIIQSEQVTQLTGVPTILLQLLSACGNSLDELNSLRAITFGGGPSTPELLAELRERLPQAILRQSYGMTESVGYISQNLQMTLDDRLTSVGKPTPVCDLRIVNSAHDDVLPGAIGEIWVRGPNIISAYWDNPQANADSFIDGWFLTGDLGRQDDEGFLYIVGRVKEVIIRGGENVYANEVERIVALHPAVLDVGVVSLPDEVYGEVVGSVVQMSPEFPISPEELKAHVRSHLAYFKVPEHILCQHAALPRNTLGKLIKADIREQLLASLEDSELRQTG